MEGSSSQAPRRLVSRIWLVAVSAIFLVPAFRTEHLAAAQGRVGCAVNTLAPNAIVKGTLTAESCRVKEMIDVDDAARGNLYEVTIPQAGMFTVIARSSDIDPYLFVYDPVARRVTCVDDDSGGGLAARCSVRTQGPATYHVVVKVAEGSLGPYTLQTSFTGAVDAATGDVAYPESAHPYADRTDLAWLYAVSGYPSSINVTFDARTEVEAGADFIDVMDGRGNAIPGSPFTGATLAGQTRTIPGDTMRIRLRTDGSVTKWGFRVTAVVTGQARTDAGGTEPRPAAPSPAEPARSGARTPCAVVDLAPNRPAVQGALESTDCRLRDVLPAVAGTDRSFVDQYRVTITEPGSLQVQLRSTAFDAFILLLDGSSQLIAKDDDSGDGTSARLTFAVRPGRYTILANSAVLSEATGRYELQVNFSPTGAAAPSPAEPARSGARTPCAVVDLALNRPPVPGTLGSTGCRFRDALSTVAASDRSFVDQYRVTITEPGSLKVQLRSTAFDAYLVFLDTQNTVIARDNNSGGGTDAQLTQVVRPGTYTILANSATVSEATGRYELQATFSPAGAAGPAPTNPGPAPSYPESPHPYHDNANQTWTYTHPGRPASVNVRFHADTEVESGFDLLDIMDEEGNAIPGSPFTGRNLAGQTKVVPGATVRIRLRSDAGNSAWGFRVVDVTAGGTPPAAYPESSHPYPNNADTVWTYTMPGRPAGINVTFDARTEVESGADFIEVMDTNGRPIPGSPFTGAALAGQTKTLQGATVKVRLRSNASWRRWGFGISAVTARPETSGAAPARPTVVATPPPVLTVPPPVLAQPPTVSLAPPWSAIPREVATKPGELPESSHPYSVNTNQTWMYTLPGNPPSLRVTFDSNTKVEPEFDVIDVMDVNGNPIPGSPFTGASLAGQTKAVPGATVRIRLKADASNTAWGFRVTGVASGGALVPSYPESPHRYPHNVDSAWSYTLAGEPASIAVTFDRQTNVEPGHDFIDVMDATGKPIAGSPFTGSSLAGQTIVVPGGTVRIRLRTDASVTNWGFRVTDIQVK